ncbi:MAG: acyl-CoA dehydrogenase, partial [Cyanobacteria bacterium]|nr:acyl-CoA dehydrogenase [Cyanobacteriota bacterium]
FLAPCIYEGEGEMLGMAFFKSLAKQHGTIYFEPIGLALEKHKIKNFNPANPAHAWALKGELMKYSWWYANTLLAGKDVCTVEGIDRRLEEHVNYALGELQQHALDFSGAMVAHQLRLPDRQCKIAELSQRVQDTITMLVTALYAHNLGDKVMIAAADILCQDLKRKLTGERPTDEYYRDTRKLADMIIEGEWEELRSVEKAEIIMPYEKRVNNKKPVAANA